MEDNIYEFNYEILSTKDKTSWIKTTVTVVGREELHDQLEYLRILSSEDLVRNADYHCIGQDI